MNHISYLSKYTMPLNISAMMNNQEKESYGKLESLNDTIILKVQEEKHISKKYLI